MSGISRSVRCWSTGVERTVATCVLAAIATPYQANNSHHHEPRFGISVKLRAGRNSVVVRSLHLRIHSFIVVCLMSRIITQRGQILCLSLNHSRPRGPSSTTVKSDSHLRSLPKVRNQNYLTWSIDVIYKIQLQYSNSFFP